MEHPYGFTNSQILKMGNIYFRHHRHHNHRRGFCLPCLCIGVYVYLIFACIEAPWILFPWLRLPSTAVRHAYETFGWCVILFLFFSSTEMPCSLYMNSKNHSHCEFISLILWIFSQKRHWIFSRIVTLPQMYFIEPSYRLLIPNVCSLQTMNRGAKKG